MAEHRYTFDGWDAQTMARAVGRNLPISMKESVEMCSYVKGRSLSEAKKRLARIIEMKDALPLRRFNHKVAHRPGMGPGRYTINTAKHVLSVLDNLEVNAQQKGLSNTVIVHACTHQASRSWRAGRHRGRKGKNTHVEFVAAQKPGTTAAEGKANRRKTTGPAATKTAPAADKQKSAPSKRTSP